MSRDDPGRVETRVDGSSLLGGMLALPGKTLSALWSLPAAAGRLPAVGDGVLELLRSVDRRLAGVQDSLAPLSELGEIGRGIAVLDRRLDSLTVLEDLPRILGAVEPLGERLNQLDGAIGRLEQHLATVAKSVAPLDGDLKQTGRDTAALRRDVAAVRLRVDGIADDGVAHLVTGLDQLVERVGAMHRTLAGLKGSVENVTEALPGNGPSLVARARDAITAIGEHSG